MYPPRPILKRHDDQSSSPNTSHINNTAANTLSNSHYQYQQFPSPRVYAQSHHNYAPHHALPNHNTPTSPMPIAPSFNPTSKPNSTRPTRSSCTVHFPPSPALTSTFACHSSTVYDRSPIVVVPNSCALPERGCPGRTYALGSEEQQQEGEEADEYDNCLSTSPRKEKRKTKTARDRDFHPRALAFAAAAAASTSPSSFSSFAPPGCGSGFGAPGAAPVSAASAYTPAALSAAYYAHNYDHLPVPALVHDLSSESDESDGVSGLPAQITGYMSALSLNPSVAGSPTKGQFGLDAHFTTTTAEALQEREERREKAHRRHRSRERAPRHERSSDPDRIPGLASAVPSSSPIAFSASPASHFSSSYTPSPSYPLSSSPPSPSSRKKGVRRAHPTTASLGLGCGGFGSQEEGCLGGF